MEVEVEGILKLEWIMKSVRIWDGTSIKFLMDMRSCSYEKLVKYLEQSWENPKKALGHFAPWTLTANICNSRYCNPNSSQMDLICI